MDADGGERDGGSQRQNWKPDEIEVGTKPSSASTTALTSLASVARISSTLKRKSRKSASSTSSPQAKCREESWSKAVLPTIQGGQYTMLELMAWSLSGKVYHAHDQSANVHVAVKMQDDDVRQCKAESDRRLRIEADALRDLCSHGDGRDGVVNLLEVVSESPKPYIVMEMLGPNLEAKRQELPSKSFSIQTVVLLATQILERIEYIHSRGILHRDIKPENFVLGVGPKDHHVYLCDFGVSKRYWARPEFGPGDTEEHVPFRWNRTFTGTARYASLNAHRGLEHGRRDDLEALGYLLVFLSKGTLPWTGLTARNRSEKYRRILEKKETTRLRDLCCQMPPAFRLLIDQARDNAFDERPAYHELMHMFQLVRKRIEKKAGRTLEDWEYDWAATKQPGATHQSPLQYVKSLQPDHEDMANDCLNETKRRAKRFRRWIGELREFTMEFSRRFEFAFME